MGSEITPKVAQKLIILGVRVGSDLFRSGNCLGTLFCSLLGLLGPSWEVPRAKRCRQSYAKTSFSKIVFFASWSSRWLSWAPLGASWGDLGPKLAPKITPKSNPKLVLKLVQKWTRFLLVFGPISGLFLGSKTGRSGGPFFQGFSGWLQMAQLGSILARLGSSWRPLGASLAPSWRHLGSSWPILAPSWPHLGAIWARLGSSCRSLGAILASSWSILAILAPSWRHLGSF